MPLPNEQMKAAADEARVAREKDAADLDAKIAYEVERDALAYSFIQEDRLLPLSDAKARADAQLSKKSPSPKAVSPTPPPNPAS